jgi:uncharacterized protein (DUF952 family)
MRTTLPRDALTFKIMTTTEWAAAEVAGRYTGSAVDRRDGFIHFSAAHQVAETAFKHFRHQDDLVLVAVDAAALGAKLVYEPSRGGDLFPHLYGVLPTTAVAWVKPIVTKPDGTHALPDLEIAA